MSAYLAPQVVRRHLNYIIVTKSSKDKQKNESPKLITNSLTMAAEVNRSINILAKIARLDKFHDIVLVAGEDGQK